eukprot:CAMPEP_0202867496 /NCGR_PEP_ID=MMETSP1391-20130828/9468_1 /ASSEMBLY_ACC=CAM_ASM_000867 /TAXON_ID=1034604 /ORGANISM="Chlamydomonas leiostraca, Strain SAG 11-49" /LENGTH=197 /DNA_ID=CAMNT_0049547545 /DNA_START=15 /DNA_END=608 /DNA_ORIENTATION=+
MGWSEDVHSQRVAQAVATARRERHLKRKGVPVKVAPNASPVAFVLAAGAAAGFVAFRIYEKQLRSIQWKELPVIKQFSQLITGEGLSVGSKGGSSGVRPKPRAAAAPAKVSASGKAKPVMKPASSTSSVPTPALAAGAAALQRAAEASKPPPPPAAPATAEEEEEEEDAEDNNPTAASATGASKKKKKRKGKGGSGA